jgi:hypothetical protein
MHAYRHQPFGLGAAHNAVLEKAREESGKNGDDVEAHGLIQAYRFARPGKTRS